MTDANQEIQGTAKVVTGALPAEEVKPATEAEVAKVAAAETKPVVPANPSWFESHPNETIGMIAAIAITGFALIVSISGL